MPRQLTLFGRPIPRFTTRRLTYIFFSLSIFALVAITTLPSEIPSSPSLSAYDHRFSASSISDSFSNSILNPLREPSHAPPRQKNDTFGGSSWWADWKWLSMPFSSSFTMDEERALLPPLRDRPYIYCYYDSTVKKSREEKDAESELLLTWRRAWWAQGFRPTILSAAEAVNNPTYSELQRSEVDKNLKGDLMRWLAWETMGGGILSHYALLPMAPWDDSLLTFLRRGEYPGVTTWNNPNGAIVVGAPGDIKKAIKTAIESSKLKDLKSVVELLPNDILKVDGSQSSLAFYSANIIDSNYKKVAEDIRGNRAKGLVSLNKLINYHLRIAWQNSFRDGIEVLKPFPEHTTVMVKHAHDLAEALASCPETPMPSSCPPNIPRCTPCIAGKLSMKIKTPVDYHNSTRVFTIGTIPHPWTLAVISNLREKLDIVWIRRESSRDPWLTTITQKLLGEKVTSDKRVLSFKQAAAGDGATSNSLWFSAEAEPPNDLDWHFGFALPKLPSEKTTGTGNPAPTATADADGENPVPVKRTEKFEGVEPEKKKEVPEDPLVKEARLLERAKGIVALTKSTPDTVLRASMEAWNLADTEAWKFARAFLARQSMERVQWEQEEAKYAGGAGSEKGRSAWSRWRDHKGE